MNNQYRRYRRSIKHLQKLFRKDMYNYPLPFKTNPIPLTQEEKEFMEKVEKQSEQIDGWLRFVKMW